ncbi:hypothetical protein HZS_3046, partial [Henneguya salminicola]
MNRNVAGCLCVREVGDKWWTLCTHPLLVHKQIFVNNIIKILSYEDIFLKSLEIMNLTTLLYFSINSENTTVTDFRYIFMGLDNFSLIHKDLKNLASTKSDLEFPLIFGFLSKITTENLLKHDNKRIFLVELFETIVTTWICVSNSANHVRTFFFGKCLSIAITKSLKHQKCNTFEIEMKNMCLVNRTKIKEITNAFIRGVISNCDQIKYIYQSLFPQYLDFIQIFISDNTIFDEIIFNLEDVIGIQQNCSIKSLKPLSLLLSIVRKFGSFYVLKKIPNLLKFTVKHLSSGEYSSNFVHSYNILIENSFGSFNEIENLSNWIDTWIMPFLHLDLTENYSICSSSFIPIWNTVCTLASQKYTDNIFKPTMVKLLTDQSLYPNILSLLSAMKKTYKNLECEYPSINAMVQKMILSNSEQ